MDSPVRGYSLEFVQSMITEQSGQLSGWFNDLELKTVFQPVYSLSHQRAIGFEANLRATNASGRPVSPQVLFGPVNNYAEISMLDKLCAALHLRNFCASNVPAGLLLINMHPEVLLDAGNSSEFLAALCGHHGLPGAKVMIDVPGSLLENDKLDEAIAAYRALGCLIAIDDFGVDNANMDTIWHARPTVVKIDRSMVARAVQDQRMRLVLRKAASLLHEMGTLVMMEGIESEAEALIALDADADFSSGYYLGAMHDSIAGFKDSRDVLGNLWRLHAEQPVAAASGEAAARSPLEEEPLRSTNIRKHRPSPAEIGRYREERRPFLNALQDVAARVRSGKALEASCDELLALPGAIRCYALDGTGIQTGAEVTAPSPPPRSATDFHTLSGGAGGNWSRRDYFRRAVKEPGVVQVTRQYCSLAGYARCVTFSIVVPAGTKPLVICADVDWTLHATTA